jgi:predicted MarR family transcription regulator
MNGKFCHLTNYSLNKFNKFGFIQNVSSNDESNGSKWSLNGLKNVLRKNGIDDVLLFDKIYDVINKSFMSVENVLR